MPLLDLDTAATVDITVKQGHSFSVTMTHTDSVTGLPVNLTGTWKMVIKDGPTEIETYTEGAGLTKAANVLTISRNVLENTLAWGFYRYEIRKDEGGISVPVYEGELIVNPVKAEA